MKEAEVIKDAPKSKKANTKNGDKPDKKLMALIIGVVVAIIFSTSSLVLEIVDMANGDTPITFSASSATDGNSANFTEGSIADVASSVSKSVVSILTETRTTSWYGQSSTSSAAGTGMIVTSDGYILTNKHVIDGANSIQVVLDDGETYDDVEVAGTDPLNDVAFLKIKDVSDLEAVKLGDSKTINVGQQVVAIGNALGQYQNSVTSGIISGVGRSITATDSSYTTSETLTDMIQTDAAINAGNSGGPLVNAAGEVIGINTATTSDANNIGFAIPISSVKGMLSSLIETGEASRAYIGVYYMSITSDIASTYNLPVTSGAYVYSSGYYSAVVSDSPAAKAGLKDKDIITAINGVKVGQGGSVSSIIGEYKPGDTIQFSILRGGKEMAINVTLGTYTEKTSSQKTK